MGEFNFNSQICTTREQSERLLALGLKKETADCYIVVEKEDVTVVAKSYYEIIEELNGLSFDAEIIPAWSLHRLIEIGFHKGIGIVVSENAYDSIISLIEKRIQNGVFNKEYLNNEN